MYNLVKIVSRQKKKNLFKLSSQGATVQPAARFNPPFPAVLLHFVFGFSAYAGP